MLTKILFTAAVIAVVYLLAKNRSQSGSDAPGQPVARVTDQSGEPSSQQSQKLPRYLAYGLLFIMLAGSGSFVFMEWRDQYRVVMVRVVNTNTGRAVEYEARRGDVEERSFETLDGRRVVLADVERLELSGP